tara:strand:- start:36 stop:344 length:309 start_codon:yes stop_codon:yes gene_type:complete
MEQPKTKTSFKDKIVNRKNKTKATIKRVGSSARNLASTILSDAKGILIVLFFVVMINSSFTLMSFLYPNITSSDTLPYQLWINALILFYFILPQSNEHMYLN